MPSDKRIAFVANTSWSIYNFRLYLLEQLIQKGYSVFVLAPRDEYTEKFEDIKGLTFIQLNKFRAKSISLLHNMQLRKELELHYRQIQPGLIFHYTVKANLYGSRAAAATKCPAISVFTGLGYAFSNRWFQAFTQVKLRKALRRNVETWFLNNDDQQLFVDKGVVSQDKTFILPGEGVDSSLFKPTSKARDTTAVTFLLIARIIKHKGVYEFSQAAKHLKQKGINIECQLLGFFDEDSPIAISRKQVEQWQREGWISYLGETDDVAPFIAGCDAVVLPSYREGLPLSLLEAASMGKAVIATDVPGCRTVVEDTVNGYLCRPKDAVDLADKMQQFCHLTPAERREMGKRGREAVLKNFTREIVTDIYLDRIKALLAPRQVKR